MEGTEDASEILTSSEEKLSEFAIETEKVEQSLSFQNHPSNNDANLSVNDEISNTSDKIEDDFPLEPEGVEQNQSFQSLPPYHEVSSSENEAVPKTSEEIEDIHLADECVFSVIEDPGLDTILSKYEASKQKKVSYGEEKYLELCKIIGVVPVESFCVSLSRDEIDLSFYGVNPKGIQAMAGALFNNSTVNTLNLEDNHLTCGAAYHLGEMLYINGTLSELNLKGCSSLLLFRIGCRGAEALANGLLSNSSLLTLNLAGNGLEDEGLKFLILPFTEHVTLKSIVLSNNGLTGRSAIRLSKTIEENCILTELDLSWNYLNSADGCKKLFTGVVKSTSLEALNMSWNALDELAAKHIALCLGKSVTLQKLDISSNSLNDNCVTTIAKGLQKNGYLKILKISMNPFTHEGAKALLEKLLKPIPILEVLDFEHIMVEKDFQQLLSQVLKVRQVQVMFGGYRSKYEIKGPNVKELLLKRAKFVAKKRKKNKKDLGQFILKLGEKPVRRDEFEDSIKGAKIKLDNDLMQELMNAFKIKKRVNLQEIKECYMNIFPDTTLVEKKKRGRKGKKSKANKGKKK